MTAARKLALATAALALLGGCHIFKGGDKPKTTVLGERIPILTAESGVDVDPGLAGVAVALPPPAANDAWAQPGGNAQKSMGQLALGPRPSQIWTARITPSTPKARLAAAPVVGGGRLYVVDTAGAVHAFDAGSGASVWATSLKGAPPADTAKKGERKVGKRESYTRSLFGGGASFDGGNVYATTGLGDVAALDAASGKVAWHVRPGGPLRGAPTFANGNVYVITQDNEIFALSAATGETLWTSAATIETAGVFGAAAPAVAQGTVVAGYSSGELNAYRYENGRVVWQDALSRTSMSTSVSSLSDIDADPVIDQGRVYAVGQGGRMVALELITGQRLWELNIAGIATPWLAGDWLFVVTDDARLICIQAATGKVRWATQLQRYRKDNKSVGPLQWTAPVLAGGRLILANSLGELVNVDPQSGAVGAKTEVGAPVTLPPLIAGNTLYLLDQKGRISAWR